MALVGLQLVQQYLLVAQAIGKQLLIQGTDLRLSALKQPADLQLFPPGSDDRATGEEGELARGDQQQFVVPSCGD